MRFVRSNIIKIRQRFVNFNEAVIQGLEHGSHLKQRLFEGTKRLGRYHVQASRFMAQAIVLVIIDAMISND